MITYVDNSRSLFNCNTEESYKINITLRNKSHNERKKQINILKKMITSTMGSQFIGDPIVPFWMFLDFQREQVPVIQMVPKIFY